MRMVARTLFLSLAALLAVPAPVASAYETISGVASVIDGDTIEIHGTRIRLHGIDTPESAQLCVNASGKSWRCGQQAALSLADRIGRVRLTCRRMDTDHYGRMIGVCMKGRENLNAWLVSAGRALTFRRYSVDYVVHGEQAKARRAGIWASRFVMPWDWRRG